MIPGHLLDQRGLADLARPGQDLDEAPRLGKTAVQYRRLRPLVI